MRLGDLPAREVQPELIFAASYDFAFAAHAAVMGQIQSEYIGELDGILADQLGSGIRNVAEMAFVRHLAGAGIDPARLIYGPAVVSSPIGWHGASL
jgi:hypothetical protein